jgi:Peptidase family M1 domain
MRWGLALVLSPCLAYAAVSAADLARQMREVSLDDAQCYRVRELSLPKDEARLYFTDGYLIFAKPIAGERTAAVFTADVEGGDAELLLLPPNRGERRSLFSYTGMPNLDEHLSAAVMVFTDDSYARLMKQIRDNPFNHRIPEMGAIMAEHWTPVVRNILTSFQVRLVLDLLTAENQRRGFFGAALTGRRLGNFDLYYDRAAREQIVLGKLNTRDNTPYFDVWTSFVAHSFRDRAPAPEFRMDDFHIDATLEPDLSLRAVTRVKVQALGAPLTVLPFDIARPMKVTAVQVDGQPAEVFQQESMRSELVRNAGNEMFLVVPPQPLQPGQAHELEFHHEGKVILETGEQVYYVGARANWYPNNGMQFATYDLTFRYPKELNLVTPGAIVEDRVEGDWRVTRRRCEAPIRMAGFNLGRYECARVSRPGCTVEVCGNRGADSLPELPPAAELGPPARLKELASEVASVVEFMTARFGPPALPTLTVAPVPARFGQGFPGLIYLSTLSYLDPREKAMQSMNPRDRLFYSEILAAHETAHQWWGNVVFSAGYHDEWLMEALADYSALLYLEAKDGPQALASVLDRYRSDLLQKTSGGQTVESTGPIVLGVRLEGSQTPRAYYAITYAKGSWIMHMLRRRMGDQNFLAMLAALRRRYQRQPVSTEQFRLLAAQFLPPKSPDPHLENFFDQWVYGTGIPTLKMSYAVKGKAPALRLNGTITQSGVEDGFSVAVPIEIHLSDGSTVTHWVHTDNGAVSFSVALRRPPVSVLLDPGYSVLRKVL